MADIGTLNPEQMLQQQQILRQQKMAEMLMQQGMQQPQGQMVSGRYVAPSIFQNLAGLANTYMGQRGIEKAEQAQLDLAKAIRGQEGVALADYMKELQGKPAVPEKVTELAGPYTKNVPMPTATIAGTPAVEGNPMLANMNALQNPNSPAFLRQFAMSEIVKKPKWEKAEYTDEKTGKTRQGVINVNSPDPISTFQVGGTKPEMTASERANLGLAYDKARDEGISISGGGYNAPAVNPVSMSNPAMNNAPIGTSPVIRQNAQPVSVVPNAPAYAQNSLTMQPVNANNLPVPPLVNMAGVSPKEQRKMAGTQAEALQANIKNAYEAYPVIRDIEKLLPQSSSGYTQRGWTGLTRGLGVSTDMSKADTQLDLLAPKLTMLQPRFEGPQGVLDVKLYESMAGRLADSTLPYEDRLAALEQLKNIYKRYSPNLDWSFAPTPVAVPKANLQQVNPQSKAPAGIDPAVWSVMTPQEKSLWK